MTTDDLIKEILIDSEKEILNSLKHIYHKGVTIRKSKDISGLNAIELVSFIKDNNIKEESSFVKGDSYCYFDKEVLLEWSYTEKNKQSEEEYIRLMFEKKIHNVLYRKALKKGFKIDTKTFKTKNIKALLKGKKIYNLFFDKDYECLSKVFKAIYTK